MRVRGPLRLTAGVMIVAMFAAGCTASESDDDDATPGAVVIGIGEPRHLIPSNTTEVNGSQVLSALFAPLVGLDERGEPTYVAAQSVTSPDNRVWTVRLRPGYTFHNGEKVTADSYLNAWNFAAYGPNAQRASYFFDKIKGYADLQSVDPDGAGGPQPAPAPPAQTLAGLKKLNDLTFTVTLSAPFVGFPAMLGANAFHPLPNAAFSAPGVLAAGFEQAIIGQGPFRLVGAWEHDRQLVLQRYADFKGTPAKVDAVTFKIYDDPRQEYADLIAGNVDVQPTVPVENLASAPQDLGDRFRKSPNSLFHFVGFPAHQKDFAAVDVRRAISMAINRQEISDQIFLGSQVPATSFVAPVVAGYRPDTCGENCTYDPAKAKQLYAAAGGPATITVTYNTDGGHQAWIDAICRQLITNLGVTCTGVGEPHFADLLTKMERKQPVGLIRLFWAMDYPLMESFLGPLFTTTGSSNYTGYNNPKFDSLMVDGAAAANSGDAISKWQAAEDLLARDMPVIPLRYGRNVYGHSERVRNVIVDRFQRVDVVAIERAG